MDEPLVRGKYATKSYRITIKLIEVYRTDVMTYSEKEAVAIARKVNVEEIRKDWVLQDRSQAIKADKIK